MALNENKIPFFGSPASSGGSSSSSASSNTADLDDEEAEIERLVQQEMKKTKKISNLRNAKGVDYAPWMNVSEEDEEKIRKIMTDKAVARRKRQEQEKKVSGALLFDSQAQELSGVGLKSKVIGEDVELEWATNAETNTLGFEVKRRAAKTEDFEVIASYKDFGPLQSKGSDGGVYRYLDTTAGVGGWVYRITECESNGRTSDLSQCLVEVQTAEEQRGAIIAAVSIGVLFAGLVVAGVLLDPNGGY